MMLGAVLERLTGTTLDQLFARWVAEPLHLPHARFVDLQRMPSPPLAAVATEQCAHRGLVMGQVHDENCHAAGGVLGHAGLFGTVDDVGIFAAAILRALVAPAGTWIGAWRSDVVQQFFAPMEGGSWRMGWDTPSSTAGVSHAGDRWPRHGGFGHLGFTGTSLWIDVPRQAYVTLLTNRVHPQRENSADGIKQLRRDVGDAAVTLIERAHDTAP
jgi:serine-type D-Ala-D-Ala carboxypeptidase